MDNQIRHWFRGQCDKKYDVPHFRGIPQVDYWRSRCIEKCTNDQYEQFKRQRKKFLSESAQVHNQSHDSQQ